MRVTQPLPIFAGVWGPHCFSVQLLWSRGGARSPCGFPGPPDQTQNKAHCCNGSFLCGLIINRELTFFFLNPLKRKLPAACRIRAQVGMWGIPVSTLSHREKTPLWFVLGKPSRFGPVFHSQGLFRVVWGRALFFGPGPGHVPGHGKIQQVPGPWEGGGPSPSYPFLHVPGRTAQSPGFGLKWHYFWW